ncbi:MAG TPA: LysM peptidoglycan-binding domain-containing protein [Candidatus Cloacimonetes bacterium]|nr:LysM peptidoglycan-binding domain-containing protein [Candidatus Cloacimonadota bacterium]
MTLRLSKLWFLLLFALLLPLCILAQETITYTVRAGDTLYGIGRRYNMSVSEIKRLNQLDSDNLRINQKLKLKAPPAPPAAETEAQPPARTQSPSEPVDAAEPTLRASPPAKRYHTVVRGDNLYRIAGKYNISIGQLLNWNNFGSQSQTIFPGQRIIVRDPELESELEPEAESQEELSIHAPAEPDTVTIEKVYVVQAKDTLYKIARENGMTVNELKRLNSLTSNDLRIGQVLYLAGSPRPAQTPFPAAEGRLTEEDLLSKDKIREDLASPLENINVLSEYGLRSGRPHKGIDLAGKTGTPIFAVLDGTVVYSGVQGAYGNVIVLEHPDFVMTVYAHNEKNLVAVGEKITKGQQIATVGSTGNATGAHLHFEYRIKGKAINPRKVLPLN